MVIDDSTKMPTVPELRDHARRGQAGLCLHRHGGEHEEEDCWCEPLVFTLEELETMRFRDINLLLAQHYAVQ